MGEEDNFMFPVDDPQNDQYGKDGVVHYVIGKKTTGKVDMALLCNHIVYHIQNNEIYFQYEPQFVNGKLIFGIVGFPHDHEHLQQVLGEKIKEFGCILVVSATSPNKEDIDERKSE